MTERGKNMYKVEATVIDSLGLHARPASILNKTCVKFKSKIKIHFGDKIIEPRSILSIMGAAVTQGSVLTIIAEGEDEVEAAETVAQFINTYAE